MSTLDIVLLCMLIASTVINYMLLSTLIDTMEKLTREINRKDKL